MTTPNFAGLIRFKIAGQEALSKWAQEAIKDALERSDSPPESLRFQCRIATDARSVFSRIELDDGTELTLHPKAQPQFGKNRDGRPYLTVTLVHSKDGESYRLRWIGDAVPRKMQEVAVKHDLGRAVRAATVRLDLADAEVTPSHKVAGRAHRSKRDTKAEYARKKAGAGVKGGVSGITRSKRHCGRIVESDLIA